VALGTVAEGWNRGKAEEALQDALAAVRLGVWEPPKPAPPVPDLDPATETFHIYASRWYEERAPTLKEKTKVDYLWRINHLLRHFADFPLSMITMQQVDRYRAAKVREADEIEAERAAMMELPASERGPLPRPLSASSINKTIRMLATILEPAVEYEVLTRNPAKGDRLLKERRPSRSFLEPQQALALLEAAATLDAAAKEGDVRRRHPLLGVMILGGLRIGEALNLKWRDVGSQKLTVEESKTDAGIRGVVLSPMLAEAITEYRTRATFTDPDDYVFPTSTGRRDGESNVRRRVLAPAVERANEKLQPNEQIVGITPHGLRRTFASLLLFAGIDLKRVMSEIGHTNPSMTLGIYGQLVTIEPDPATLEVMVGRGYRAQAGVQGDDGASAEVEATDPRNEKTPL
jgi:integrase